MKFQEVQRAFASGQEVETDFRGITIRGEVLGYNFARDIHGGKRICTAGDETAHSQNGFPKKTTLRLSADTLACGNLPPLTDHLVSDDVVVVRWDSLRLPSPTNIPQSQ